MGEALKVQRISDQKQIFAIIIRADCSPDKTVFYTDDELNFQAGHIIYKKDTTIPRHIHKPISRHVIGTNEALIVQKGSCNVKIYNNNREFIKKETLFVGDVILLNGGGHEFIALEELQLLEIKQGPYIDRDEKEHF